MQRVDIPKILQQRAPRVNRWIPRFAVRALERLLCVRRINSILDSFSHLPPVDFIAAALQDIGVSYTLHGRDNLPRTGRFFFASNHPLGGLDGLVLAHALSTQYDDTKLIVNDLLMNIEPLAPIFVPVNKNGAQSTKYYHTLEQLYHGHSQIITFPAGFCSRLINGKIEDTPWRISFVIKAQESNRQVVPIYVDGQNSKWFYRIERLRRFLGVRFNVGMLLLPREMFTQKRQHLDIYIGQPITIDSSLTPQQWSQKIREICYSLKDR
ncbi:MAG: 1-acyl-sn-glycerol-3-phosphate acyltransferase [Mucinivorans sp.]